LDVFIRSRCKEVVSICVCTLTIFADPGVLLLLA
jgi:hypothetical protein